MGITGKFSHAYFCAAIFVLAFIAAPVAQAQVFFRPGFMYMMDEEDSNGTKINKQRQLIDLGFGYIGTGQWTVGGLYATERNDKKTTVGTNTPTEDNRTRTSIGASAGWTSQGVGPYVLATYFFQSEYVKTALNYKGTGYQLDVGMRFPVKQTFAAIQLSYKTFEYKKYSSGSTEVNLSKPEVNTYLDPYFVLFFQF